MNPSDVQIAPTRRTWLQLACVWLSIAIALANALVPYEPSMYSRPGSAFSPFNYDVSLGPARAGEPADALGPSDDRDRQLRLGGGHLALLSRPLPANVPRVPDAGPGAAVFPGLLIQAVPRSHDARAPPRARSIAHI